MCSAKQLRKEMKIYLEGHFGHFEKKREEIGRTWVSLAKNDLIEMYLKNLSPYLIL